MALQSDLEQFGLVAHDYEDLVVADVSVGLTTAKLASPTVFAVLVADGGDIRFTRSGQTAATTTGLILRDGSSLWVSRAEALKLQMVRNAAVNVTMHVEYYRAP